VGIDTELPQMMIKMLVHQDGPFVRRELAEKTVRVFGAANRPGAIRVVEAVRSFAGCSFLRLHRAEAQD